jgi:hypothetical protein
MVKKQCEASASLIFWHPVPCTWGVGRWSFWKSFRVGSQQDTLTVGADGRIAPTVLSGLRITLVNVGRHTIRRGASKSATSWLPRA